MRFALNILMAAQGALLGASIGNAVWNGSDRSNIVIHALMVIGCAALCARPPQKERVQ